MNKKLLIIIYYIGYIFLFLIEYIQSVKQCTISIWAQQGRNMSYECLR